MSLTKANTRMLEGNLPNSQLENDSITINGSAVALGGSTTIATGGGVSALPYFSATNEAGYTFDNGSLEGVHFQVDVLDPSGCFNNSSSSTTLNGIATDPFSFAPNVSGIYHLGVSIQFQTVADNTSVELLLRKNGGNIARTIVHSSTSKDLNPHVSTIIPANGSSDDFQVAVLLNGSQELIYSGHEYTKFWGYRIA